jgi:hypothetical protein
MIEKLFIIICLASFIIFSQSKCAYTQPEGGGLPYIYDGDSFNINYTMTACQEYIGDDVCCNKANA